MIMRMFAAGACALGLAGAAGAQDYDGPYAGGTLGYVWGSGDYDLRQPVDPNTDLVGRGNLDYDGFDLGGYVGYRFALPNGFVVGFEGGGGWAWADGSNDRSFAGGTLDLRTSAEKNNELYLSAKAGIPVRGVTLVYGIAGVQTASFDLSTRNLDGGGQASGDDRSGGWHLGLGAEYFFAPTLSTRVEWKYQDFGSVSVSGGGGRVELEQTENVLRLGVSYNF